MILSLWAISRIRGEDPDLVDDAVWQQMYETFSGSDIRGILSVVVAAGGIYFGFRKRGCNEI